MQVYLVTGGSAGIGFGIVSHLLSHNPAKILMLSMKEEHADQAMESLKDWGDTSKVEWVQCNLESLKQVDETVKNILDKENRLDAVCTSPIFP
jgi:WW domain-containing oxidoreductase